jgi:hypothetical protein
MGSEDTTMSKDDLVVPSVWLVPVIKAAHGGIRPGYFSRTGSSRIKIDNEIASASLKGASF